MTHHTVFMNRSDDYRREQYGVLYESAFRYYVGRQYGTPVRFDVWENRDGKDPNGNPTDAKRSILLTPQATVISNPPATRQHTDGIVRDGDTATLVYPQTVIQDVALHFPRHGNDHGYATPLDH